MLLDTSGLVSGTAPSMQRASLSRFPGARLSLSNAAFISTAEYDDLRAKYSQAKRELLKVSDVQKDLDFARFELTRAQEELKLLTQSNQALQQDLNDAVERAERAVKAKSTLEGKMAEAASARSKEVEFLRDQIEQLRQDNAKRLADLAEQQESESQNRIQAMRDELAALSAEMQSMAEQLDDQRRECDRIRAAHAEAAAQLATSQETAQERERRLTELREELQETRASHQRFVQQATKEREEAMRDQQGLADQRVEQVLRSKDACIAELKDELRDLRDKCRSTADECASLRNTNAQLTEEVKLCVNDHAKELRRLAEEHRLALCEKEMQMESALREAKGNRSAAEEECHNLRRQLAKVSEELSTVAAVLVQRERQLSDAEKDSSSLKERLLALEQDNVQLASDAEMNAAAAEEALERVRRLNEQKDTLEEEFSKDLCTAKERVRALEASLMEAREELSTLRRQEAKAGEAERSTVKELRAALEAMTEERTRLAQALSSKNDAEMCADELRKRYTAEKARADALSTDLAAAMSRCTVLEKRLDDELRRAISRAVTTTAAASTTSPSSRTSPSASAGMRLRSTSSVNARLGLACTGSSMKRARTEDARVFAISGFDGNELLSSIKQLPNVAIAECKSNMPVPSNLTHLITNGQLTVKLLTALVRGCWVLPEAYVVESLKQRMWLPEHEFGFQHEELPLLKRRVVVTDGFAACKHNSTALLLLREGGAVVNEGTSPDEADYVICTNHELGDYGANGMSWEKLVELIYPVRVE